MPVIPPPEEVRRVGIVIDAKNLTPNPFPSGKGNKIVESNLFLSRKGIPDFKKNTGCRGYLCPRRCGTHGGFRI